MSKELATQKEVQDFIDAARRYCQLFETAERHSVFELLSQLTIALGSLYSAALLLPKVRPSDNEVAGETLAWADLPDLPDLGDFESYWEVYNPYERKDALLISLSDSLRTSIRTSRAGCSHWKALRPLI